MFDGWRWSTGARGERIAARTLRRAGYRILGRNLRTRFGEIDLVAETGDGQTVVVVEVKTSVDPDDAWPPEQRVDPRKQKRLVALAAQLLRAKGWTGRPVRFDIVGVRLRRGRGKTEVLHWPGAFAAHV
jgi:putative endonuclease